FADVGACVDYATELVQSGVALARCELVDAPSITAINRHLGLQLAEAATVFLEFHGDRHTTAADVSTALQLSREHAAGDRAPAKGEGELRALWRARVQVFYCITAEQHGLKSIVTDLDVSISSLPAVVASG